MLKYDTEESNRFIVWMNDKKECSLNEHTMLHHAFDNYRPEHKMHAFYQMAKEQFPAIYKRYFIYKMKRRLLNELTEGE